jgi:hypothetical protein
MTSLAVPPNLVKGGSFDGPESLDNWRLKTGLSQIGLEWAVIDSLGRPESGSLAVSARRGGISQCVPVTGGTLYDFGARVLVPRRFQKLNRPGPNAYLEVDFSANGDCTSAFLAQALTERALAGPSGRFVSLRGTVAAPEEARSALISLLTNDDTSNLQYNGDPSMFDDVFLQQAGGCAPDHQTLCLAGGKLRASATYFDAHDTALKAFAIQVSPTTGYFYTYSADDAELTVKTIDLDASGKWVVIGGMTNLRLIIAVQDVDRHEERTYTNESGHFLSPIVDMFPAN